MEDKDLIVGTRVAKAFSRFNQHENDICKGEIAGIGKCPTSGKPKYAVKWDKDWMQGYVSKEPYADDLMSEAEANTLWSKLEAEFREVEDRVKSHLEVAAQAINDADKLATGANLNLNDMWKARALLFDAMDNAGWSTSSLNC